MPIPVFGVDGNKPNENLWVLKQRLTSYHPIRGGQGTAPNRNPSQSASARGEYVS